MCLCSQGQFYRSNELWTIFVPVFENDCLSTEFSDGIKTQFRVTLAWSVGFGLDPSMVWVFTFD